MKPELIRASLDAQFIFDGRVVSSPASNLKGMPTSELQALVRVEEVVVAPSSLGDLQKRTITIVLQSKLVTGRTATFFARSWVIGAEIGVTEIARVTGKISATLKSEILELRLRNLDSRIADRLAKASAAIAGTVIYVEEVGVTQTGEGTHWRLATVRVSATIMGTVDAEVRILFPGIGGPRWVRAPRFVPGQEAVWILHSIPKDFAAGRLSAKAQYVALEPEDVHSIAHVPRLELLARERRQVTPKVKQ